MLVVHRTQSILHLFSVLYYRLPALPFIVLVAVLHLLCIAAFAQQSAPERIVSPVSSGLPGRTVWAFATSASAGAGTGTSVTTFAATDKGLFRSSGTSWTETSLRNQAVYAVKSRRVGSPSGNASTLLVGTDRGVLRSTDNGNTWSSPEVTTGTTVSTSNILSLKKVFDIEIIGNFWFAATEKGVFRSNNDGRSWTLINIDRTVDNNEVRGITAEGNTIIVNLWREGLWRSTNNGNSWSKLTITGETALCRALHVQEGTNATIWLAGSVAGNIWRSVNNGSTWTRVYQTTSTNRSISSSALTQTGIDAIIGNGRTVFAATPGGIAYSRSYGQTWRHTRTTTPQAVSLALHGNSLHVGLEKQSSLIAHKYSGSQLTSGDDSYGIYCTATQLDYNPYMGGVELCGGGSSGTGTGIIPPNPSITAITPNPSQTSTTPVSITINGTNLLSAYVQVRIYPPNAGGAWYFLPISSVTQSQINATVPATFANTVGAYGIQVVHGSDIEIIPDETPVSGTFTWNVAPPQIPTPALTTITPQSVFVNQAATLTLSGSNFAANAQVWIRGFDGSPTQLQRIPPSSSTILTANIPALPISGTYQVYVTNPGNAVLSQERSFTVLNPQAVINTITTSPSPVVAGQSCTVTVNGTGFVSGISQVTLNSGAVSSPTITPTAITFSFVPQQGGTYTVSVQNPGTNPVNGQFTVQTPPPTPVVSNLTQNGQPTVSTFFNAGEQTLTLNGANFQATTLVRLTLDNTTIERTPSAWTPNSLTFTLPASLLTQPQKIISVSAFTPPFPGTTIGGGSSAQSIAYYVVMPAPTLPFLANTSSDAGASSFTLHFTGSGIALGHTVMEWTMNGVTSVIPVEGSEPNWRVGIGNELLKFPAVATLRLRNPTLAGIGAQAGQTFGGGLSQGQSFTINNIQPRLDSIQPRVYGWLGVETGIQLIIDGNNFVPTTTKLLLNGLECSIIPQNASSTRITHNVNFADVGFTPPGILTVRVKNPAQGTISATNTDLFSVRTDTFRVVNPTPRIFTAAPEYTMTTIPAQITLSGDAFLNGVSASIGGVNAPVQRNSANQIVVQFDAAVQARLQQLGAGVHHLIVRNPAPALADASLPITLVNPNIITLTVQPNPHTLTAPPSAQTVTLTALQSSGTPYIATNATVSFRGQTFPISSRPSADRVTVTIPASLLGEAGNFPITINQPAVLNAQGQSVGASSQSAAWVLNNPRPVVSGMTSAPAPVIAGADVILTIDGSAFVPLAKVVVRGTAQGDLEYTPSANSGTRLTVTIPASALDSLGTFPVIVRNPQGGGDALLQPQLTVLAPRPRLSVMAPQTSILSLSNQQPVTLSFGGSGFVRGSRLVWNLGSTASVLPTTYTNNAQVSATIPANLLTQAGIYRLAVVNDALLGQGGGTSDTLTFTLNNPTATLFNAAPLLLPRFAASQVLTLTGDNFVQGARVLVSTNGAPGLNNVVDTLTASVTSPTQIQTTLPASLLDSAATLLVRVLNPAPVQSASGAVQVSVVNPRPRLTNLSPNQTLTGAASLVVTASGTTFMDGLQAVASGSFGTLPVQTSRTNDNLAVLTLPASVLAQAGTVSIALQNPAPRVQPDFSDTLSITVNNPLPRLDSAIASGLVIGAVGISQGNLLVSTQATTVTLFGDNFILASQVKENGSSISGGGRSESTLSSSRLSLNQITTVVPATMTAEAGTVRLTVENPTPGGGRSGAVTLNVLHPVPVLERITPSVVTIPAGDVSITLTGDRFVNTPGKASDVLVNGQSVTVTQRSATRLTATIPAAMLASRGFYTVSVRNIATNGADGGLSETLLLRVNTPQPLLTAVSPAQIPLDTLDVPITINGSRFMNEAIVRITTPDGVSVSVATTSISAGEIRATLPASLINRGGIYNLRVENPAPTDSPSEALTFALVNPVPQMDSITPTVLTPELSTQNSTRITVRGQKFTPTSVVRWRGQDLPTTFVSRTTLTATIPPNQQTRGAVGAVTVFTPTDGVVVAGMPVGGGIGSAPGTAGVLTITHGTPTLTASTPATVLRDAWAANPLPTITLNGQLLASTATVRIQSAAGMTTVDTVLTPTSVSANGQSLMLTLPRSVVSTAGTFSLTVINPRAFSAQALPQDGGTSSALSLTVQNPTPALASLNPASLAAASPTTLLTINGTNFTRETQLFVNGSPAPRTVLSASQLTTSLPAELFTLSGFVRVQVVNPAPSASGAASGDSSNTLQLEIFNPVPALTSISPVFAPIGGRAPADSVTLTLVGTNFVRNSVARIATTVAGAPTTDLPTTFVATNTLTVRILAADWRAGAYNITVLNPAPRGGVSAARRFTVTNPLPVLTALLPNSTTASGRAWTLRVVGNFFTATSQISYNRVVQSLANTQYIPNSLTPSTQDTLLVRLPAVPVGDTTFPVVVVNPPTGGVGGGASDTLRLAIGLPAPTIISLSPVTTTATLGDVNRQWTLTVNGTLFDDQAKVIINGQPVFTEFVSSTRLRAVLPDSMQARQARRSVQVRNTPLLASNIVTHTVQNPAPVLGAIEPQSIIAGRDTVITLSGDRFAPDATVRLTFGTTSTVLTPSRRDSVIRLTVPLPSSLIPSRGAYSLRVSNPALAPTMVLPDTLALGGGLSGTQTLTVNADRPHSVEYIGLDTLLYTGDRLWFFTLRFRDKTGNLVDNDPVLASYTNLDSTIITGSFPMTRTSLGNYSADTLRFPTAGRYLVQVDTTHSGRLVVLGQDRFTVLTRSASRVEIEGVSSTFTAGDSLPRLTFRYFDTQNNPTDVGGRVVIVTATVNNTIGAPAYRDTLVLTRTQTGVYQSPQRRYTGSALYTITPLGIATANITGERTFTVTPRPAASVLFTGVTPLLTTGGAQARFRATLRDAFQNLTDVVQPDSLTTIPLIQVFFSLSTDATSTNGALDDSTKSVNAGFFTVQRTSLGVFTADAAAPFLQAGNYALSIQGVNSTSGTAAFTVRPNVDFRVVVEGVPDTLTAGDSLKNVVVRYFDRNNNPTDNSLGRVVYARAGGSSTATVQMSRLETGVYALHSTQATLAGNYTLSVSGITSLNIEGKRIFVVKPDVPVSVEMLISTSAMTSRGSNVTFSLTYFDAFTNLTDWNSTLTIRNAELASTATVELIRQSVGKFRKTITVIEPGGYDIEIDSEPSSGLEIIGANNFACSPGRPVRVRFSNVPSTLTAGEALTGAFMTFFDVRGRTTNNNWQILMLGSRGAEIIEPINFSQRDAITTQHSGIFDIDPTVFATAGVNTLVVQSDVDYQLPITGNNQFTVTPGQAVAATIQTIPTNATVSAGSPITLQIRFVDQFGQPTYSNEKIVLTTNATIISVIPSRTSINGKPAYNATVRLNTVATYSISIPNTVVTGTTNIVVYDGIARTAAFQNLFGEITVGDSQFFTLLLRDNFGNLATNAPQLNFSNGSTSTGTISLIRLPNGSWSAQSLPFIVPGNYTLSFTTPPSITMSGTRTFRVLGNPLPELRDLSPFQVTLNTSATLIASGNNFVQGATAVINNIPIPTIFRSPTQVEIQLPTSFTATLGSMILNIRNPAPGGGISSIGIYITVVNPVPVLLALRPATIIRDCSEQSTAFLHKTSGLSAQAPTSDLPTLPTRKPIPGQEQEMSDIRLYPASPNPFSDQTEVRYALSQDARIQIEILDSRLQKATILVNEDSEKGEYSATWKPRIDTPSGTYYIRLTATTKSGHTVQRQQTITFIK